MTKRENWALFVFFVFCAYMGLNTKSTPPALPYADTFREDQNRRDALVAQAEVVVQTQLIDPDSAKFRNIVAGAESSACGLVNSKNRFGGYTGFRHFIYVENSGVMFEGAHRFKEYYGRYCIAGRSTWSVGLAPAAAAPVQQIRQTDNFNQRVERWARLYMAFPVVKVDISKPDAAGWSEVMIEMRLGATPLTISGRISHAISDRELKQVMITMSMTATDAMLRR